MLPSSKVNSKICEIAFSVILDCQFQEILALTGGGKTREYTETRPDGSTVTYTIDVEEEVIEVRYNLDSSSTHVMMQNHFV